jgi:hypothetical protein
MPSVVNLLENLGAKVSLYRVYEEELLSEHARFTNALAVVYMDIISIMLKAQQRLQKNSTSTTPSSSTVKLSQ